MLLEIQSLMGQMCALRLFGCVPPFLKGNENLDALPLCNFTAAGLLPWANFILVSTAQTAHASSLFPTAEPWSRHDLHDLFPAFPRMYDCDKRNQIFVSIRQGSPLSISQRQRQVQSSCSWLSELMWMQAFTLSWMAGETADSIRTTQG